MGVPRYIKETPKPKLSFTSSEFVPSSKRVPAPSPIRNVKPDSTDAADEANTETTAPEESETAAAPAASATSAAPAAAPPAEDGEAALPAPTAEADAAAAASQ